METLGIFNELLVFLCQFGIYVVIWYTFSCFGIFNDLLEVW
jgi:hypothetical protein